MTRPRFELLAVEQKGYPVVRIHDHALDQDYMIYRRGSRLFHWSRHDQPVDGADLRRVAREALNGATASDVWPLDKAAA